MSIAVPSPVNLRDPARQSRELLLADALADGWVILHASAVVRDGRGWIFAGDKGSGKTTLAVAALSCGEGFEYLANDRLLARADADGRVVLRPYAISVRLGGGTLRNHPRLRAHLHPFDHFDAAILPLEDQFAHDDKLELTVGEYAEILGCAVADGAVLERIILPTMDFEGDPQGTGLSAKASRVSRTATEELLHSCLMIPDPDGTGWLRGLVGVPDEITDSMRHTMRIMADVGVLRLRGTPQAMLTAALAEDAENL